MKKKNTSICPFFSIFHSPLHLSQNITPLAAPDHQRNHSQCEENGDENKDGQCVIRWVHPHHLRSATVGEKVLVYADDVALHQWIGPVAVHLVGLCLRAECEDVVLTVEKKGRR